MFKYLRSIKGGENMRKILIAGFILNTIGATNSVYKMLTTPYLSTSGLVLLMCLALINIGLGVMCVQALNEEQ